MAATWAEAAVGLTRLSWPGLSEGLSRWRQRKVGRLATMVELVSGDPGQAAFRQ
jgi:hypothetical protein